MASRDSDQSVHQGEDIWSKEGSWTSESRFGGEQGPRPL